MQKLTIDQFKKMWDNALAQIKARENEFSQLDAVIGDGDHGTAIVQALTSIVETAQEGAELKAMLNDMGFNVMMATSGSTSTLIGGLLLGMSDNSEGTELDVEQVKKMFVGGLEGVQKQTKAKVGDKTMMDALIPAVDSMKNSSATDIKGLLKDAAVAAQKGADATIEMEAKFGRARNYGEKSVGHPDSGATSWACMFSAFAESVN